jgi:hypothetical protein
MSKGKGKPRARGLKLDEFFILCGGSRDLMCRLLAGVEGKKEIHKFILERFVNAMKTISVEDREKFLKLTDEDEATRLLRHMAREITAGKIQPARMCA